MKKNKSEAKAAAPVEPKRKQSRHERAQSRASQRHQQRRRRKEDIAAQKQQRRQAERAYDGNLFNRISRSTHAFATRIFSNLRFSLGLRISVNYARLLLSSFFKNLLLFVVVYCIFQGPQLLQAAQYTAGQLASVDQPQAELTELWNGEYYRAEFISVDAQEMREAEMPEWLLELRRWISPVDGFELMGKHPVMVTRHTVYRDDQARVLYLRRDLWPETVLFGWLLLALFVFDLCRALWFLVAGRNINRKVLKPIADITQHAQMLSAHDLSLRLNIEGTKNELKDLALVINEMLDRIEMAYNGQKQFVSDASHELRTPIAVIQGYAGLLQRWGKDSPQVRDEALAAILAETENMKQLVEKLLFLARHDKRTLVLQKEHFDARQLMEEVIRETEMITSGHVVEAGKLDAGILYGDRGTIKQALRIFIDNAVKYTPAGGQIRISLRHEGDVVRIAIADTGVGMNKKEMKNIFDRFYRADAARNSQVGGHGLGLSIAKIIVLSHGGKIHVHSQKGVGTTFEILLPS